MKKLNGSVAGRLEMIRSLLGGEAVLDDDGNPTGELTPQIITEEQARKLIGMDAPAEVIEMVGEIGERTVRVPIEEVKWMKDVVRKGRDLVEQMRDQGVARHIVLPGEFDDFADTLEKSK